MNNENKTNINWYPGHMLKTKKQIIEDIKLIDVVIEILDARIPISSQNPDIKEIIKNKKRIIILNKFDLADEKQNKLWVQHFKKENITAILTNANTGIGINNIFKEIENIMKEDLEKNAIKGRVGKTIRVLVVGIPNVGKSSFINRIANKTSAIVGNKPGVTKKKQWVRASKNIEILDTPGVLWPKFKSQEVALNLSYTGTIKDDILEKTEIAFNLLTFLLNNYYNNVIEKYKLDKEEINNILNNKQQEQNQNIYEIMQLIGKKRGAIISGGNVDDEKTASIILDDFRAGKLGKITLEKAIKN